jgi:Peptidase family M28
MRITRRQLLAATITAAPLRRVFAPPEVDAAVARRIAATIREFEAQGFHRTATPIDRASGEWLAEQVKSAGLKPSLEPFPIQRVDPVSAVVVAERRRIEGIPLFDAAFTSANGVSGRLGSEGGPAEILLVETAVNASGAGALGDARRANTRKAIVAITRGGRPGLCPSNADSFLSPFGPPVVQVSSEEAVWLTGHAAGGGAVTVVAHVKRTAASADNVTAAIDGTDPSRPPLVVMTPRSGWYGCASERGGGIAVWLEMMRALRASPPVRPVWFVASSGHELGHLGINAYIDRRPGVVANAVGWLHLGANVGAATDPATTLQASDDHLDALVSAALTAVKLRVDRRAPRGRVPSGEAEAVHRRGGRYVSIIGGNALFHNPADHEPDAVDPDAIARFAQAFTAVARQLANG